MRRELTFGAFAPDQVGSPLGHVVNMVPVPDGWAPFPLPSPTSTLGLAGIPMLLVAVRSATGVDYTLAATDDTVFKAGAHSWEPLTGSFNAVWPWQCATYGDLAYLVNGRDPVLVMDLNGSTGPVPVADLPNGLGFRYLAQVADVVMGGWAVEAEFNQHPFRTQWTGVGRPNSYIPSTTTGADFQDHTDIGEIRGLVGGESCLIHGARGLIRGDYVGPPLTFEFHTLETDVGCQYSGSLAWSSGRCFWWSESGFRFSGGGQSQAIGFGLVDDFFRKRLRKDFASRITAAIYPDLQLYMVAYPGPDAFDGVPSEMLAYNYALADPNRRWGFAKAAIGILGRGTAIDNFTDDPLRGDVLTDSEDGNTDDGQDIGIFGAAIDANGDLCRLSVLASTVVEIETGELRLLPGRRARVTRAWPLVESAPADMRLIIKTRERQESDGTNQVSPALRLEDSGSIGCDDAGMLHRFNLTWSGSWPKARGLAVEYHPQGGR